MHEIGCDDEAFMMLESEVTLWLSKTIRKWIQKPGISRLKTAANGQSL